MFSIKRKQSGTKVLWMTDTFDDHNGVSMALQSVHREIIARGLEIDIMVCSKTLKADKNLIVIKPLYEFSIPFYRQQVIRIPDFLKIQRVFRRNRYNRIICSTEGPMGFASLYLRRIFRTKTFFFLHTDWLMFGSTVLGMKDFGLKRLQQAMKAFYHQFDGVFVLNSDQWRWLTNETMGFDADKVMITAHWADSIFNGSNVHDTVSDGADGRSPAVLFAGRLSAEKGIFELPGIFRKASLSIPNLRMKIAGTGPSEEEFKAQFPEADFTGWVDHSELPAVYRSADLLVLPSRFDTFSCVVLEALSCGLPVIAYNIKGPKDIIQDRICGFLVETPEEMSERITQFFSDAEVRKSMKEAALVRSKDYSAANIMDKLLQDLYQPSIPAHDEAKAA